jgi:hypothetical protein
MLVSCVEVVTSPEAADIWIGEAGDECPSRWELFQVFERLPNLVCKSLRYFLTAFAVPRDCFGQLTFGSLPQANASQRESTSR